MSLGQLKTDEPLAIRQDLAGMRMCAPFSEDKKPSLGALS